MTLTSPDPGDVSPVVMRPPDPGRAARRLGFAVWGSLGAACVMAGAAVTAQTADLPGALALLAVAGALASSTRSPAQRWRAYRQMAGLELLIHPQYVSYRCASGTWTVPWPDVRRVQVVQGVGRTGPPTPTLCVEAVNWGGPLSELGPLGHIRIPLDSTSVDLGRLAQIVADSGGGRFALTDDAGDCGPGQPDRLPLPAGSTAHSLGRRTFGGLGLLVYAAVAGACAMGAVWLAGVVSRRVLGGPTTTGLLLQLLAATAAVGAVGSAADHLLTRLSQAGRVSRVCTACSPSPPAPRGHDANRAL